MANMSPTKNPIPEQDPNVRNKNFEEVALGYTVEMAVDEANRCLNCPRPACMSGCPVNVKIPQFIACVREQDFKGAYHKILEDSSLPAICGRVCPQEKQCESKCVRGIKGEPVGIGRLERFVADWNRENADEMPEKIATNGHRVAVIGSGPSGLACASDLAKLGYDVTVYEHFHKAGGVLAYGIPEFRLPKSIVQKEVDGLKAMGVKVETNIVVGRTITIDELMEENGFEAVFVGSGAGLPMFMHIPGENLKGVYSANEFLTRINLMKAYREDSDTPIMDLKGKKVAVVGGGNVAMDAARTAIRRGAENVTIVYHKTEAEISSFPSEYEAAVKEGVQFNFLKQPIAYLNKKQMRALNNIRRKPAESDETDLAGLLVQNITKTDDGQFVTEGGQEVIPCDCVILAIGQRPAARIVSTTKGIQVDDRGFVITRERPYGMTTRAGVFSSGDVVHGPATVVLAMKESKKVAAGIAQYIDAKKLLEDCCED